MKIQRKSFFAGLMTVAFGASSALACIDQGVDLKMPGTGKDVLPDSTVLNVTDHRVQIRYADGTLDYVEFNFDQKNPTWRTTSYNSDSVQIDSKEFNAPKGKPDLKSEIHFMSALQQKQNKTACRAFFFTELDGKSHFQIYPNENVDIQRKPDISRQKEWIDIEHSKGANGRRSMTVRLMSKTLGGDSVEKGRFTQLESEFTAKAAFGGKEEVEPRQSVQLQVSQEITKDGGCHGKMSKKGLKAPVDRPSIPGNFVKPGVREFSPPSPGADMSN